MNKGTKLALEQETAAKKLIAALKIQGVTAKYRGCTWGGSPENPRAFAQISIVRDCAIGSVVVIVADEYVMWNVYGGRRGEKYTRKTLTLKDVVSKVVEFTKPNENEKTTMAYYGR